MIAINAGKELCMNSRTLKQEEADMRSEIKQCCSITWNHDTMLRFLLKNKKNAIASIQIATMTQKMQV